MKVAIILANLPTDAPFVECYEDVLYKQACKVDIIGINRRGINSNLFKDNWIVFDKVMSIHDGILKKTVLIFLYFIFICKVLFRNKYDKIIVNNISLAIYFTFILPICFNNKYILDIRDYSNLCNNKILKKALDFLIKHSYKTVISSPGFLEWLPSYSDKYLLSHNTSNRALRESHITHPSNYSKISILTIGIIRGLDTNIKFIDELANNQNYDLFYAGIGEVYEQLKVYCKSNDINNCYFLGRYDKLCENNLVSRYDILNSYLPHNITEDFLLSNRLYLSIINYRPILVTDNSTQAEYVKKYGIGLPLNDKSTFVEQIDQYMSSFNIELFIDGCNRFKDVILNDMLIFENHIKKFYHK